MELRRLAWKCIIRFHVTAMLLKHLAVNKHPARQNMHVALCCRIVFLNIRQLDPDLEDRPLDSTSFHPLETQKVRQQSEAFLGAI